MNLPDDQLPARALVLDRELIRRAYAWRTAHENRPHDEVWDGTLVLCPLPDNEHRRVVMSLAVALAAVSPRTVLLGCNVSDRDADWGQNYREPDVAV